MKPTQHSAIIGAGLCGSLLAVRLAQKGEQVSIFERRADLRTEKLDAGRSINLALSSRGLQALDLVGLKEAALRLCIPMHGRLIHSIGQEPRFSKYSGRQDDYINSISRPGLNALLLNEADKYDSIHISFEATCTALDPFTGKCTLKKEGETQEMHFGQVFGTDGAGSIVRRSLMANTTKLLFNYSQSFLTHGYKELSIPAGKNGEHQLLKNALHIWPRGQHMVIALPNLDGSFTVTMFHPYAGEAGFDTIKTNADVDAMFTKYYPNLIPLIPHLHQEYFANPVGTLGTIKCNPWQANNTTLVLGDAAHAIVPFYGQGMNASLEDVYVLDKMITEHGRDHASLFAYFQEERMANADAIADLAVDNFYEMRDKVADPIFIKQRSLEMKLEQTFPDYYSKYSLVTFRPDLSYSEAKRRGRKQNEVLHDICADSDVDTLDLDKVMQQIRAIL